MNNTGTSIEDGRFGWVTPRWREALSLRNAGVYYALILLIVVFAVAASMGGKPAYLSTVNTANIFDQAAQIGILAIFMTIVLISGNFDLSVAASAALCGGVAMALVDSSGLVFGLIVGISVGLVIGLINGLLVEMVGVNAFIVTLGTMTAVRGVLLIATDGNSIQASDDALKNLVTGTVAVNLQLIALAISALIFVGGLWARRRGRQSSLPIVVAGPIALIALALLILPTSWPMTKQVGVMLVIGATSWAVLRYTLVGRRLYAVGGNPEAARLSGIAVHRYRIVPFVLTGFGAGIAGILYAGTFGSVSPDSLQGTELTVLAAAILGGTSLFGGVGSVVKSVIGALILVVLANGFGVLNLGANYQQLIQGAVIVGAAATYAIAERHSRNAPPKRRLRPGPDDDENQPHTSVDQSPKPPKALAR